MAEDFREAEDYKLFQKCRELLPHLTGNEELMLLLTDSCDLCGRKFDPGEEFFLLSRVRRRAEGFGEVRRQTAMCLTECAGVKVVKI